MITIDEFEPREIEALIKQVFPNSFRTSLNRAGFADYLYTDSFGEKEQVERKQVGEIFADMDGVEYQLRSELNQVRQTILLIEGVAVPGPKGIHTFTQSPNGRIMRPGRYYGIHYSRYEAWLWGLEQAGVTVWRTANWEATADALVTRARSVARPEHTTLQRHLKPMPEFHPNPHVQTLMNIKGEARKPLLGPDKAQELIKVFETAWNVVRQDAETLAEFTPGLGIVTAKAVLKAFGKKVE
jgi:hypothetical protein